VRALSAGALRSARTSMVAAVAGHASGSVVFVPGFSSDEFMTVAEIAAVLKLNQQTIRNWIFRPGVGVFPDAVGLQRW
jgi:hypothetical protein